MQNLRFQDDIMQWDASVLALTVKLWLLADNQGLVRENAQQIANRIGVSRDTIVRGLHELERAGVIQRVGKQAKVNVYRLVSRDVRHLDTRLLPDNLSEYHADLPDNDQQFPPYSADVPDNKEDTQPYSANLPHNTAQSDSYHADLPYNDEQTPHHSADVPDEGKAIASINALAVESAHVSSSSLPIPADPEPPARRPAQPKRTRRRAAKTPPSDASRLVHRHAELYTARFGQPFPVAWARDTQITKRLVAVYGADQVETLQDRYLAQSLDSFAGKRGFSIPQFAADIAGLAAQTAIAQGLTEEQRALVNQLVTEGMEEATAIRLVTEHPARSIEDQITVQHWRRQQGMTVSPSRLERAIRERWAVPPEARPVTYPRFPGSEAEPNANGPEEFVSFEALAEDPAIQALLAPLASHFIKVNNVF